MSDVVHLTDNTEKTWMFQGISESGALSANTHFEVWKRSWVRRCNLMTIWMVGAGGAGGSGFTKGSAGSAGGGGGGGGGAGWLRACFILDQMPEVIYFAAPQGGTGVGGRALMSFYPGDPATTLTDYLISAAADATAGGNGTGSGGGANGTGGTVATASNSPMLNMAVSWGANQGAAGGAGGTQTGGTGGAGSTAIGAYTGSGGGGGGGSQSADFAGGAGGTKINHSTTGAPFTMSGGAAGPNDGPSGISIIQNDLYYLHASGASGGGSTNTAGLSGGKGGDGGFGCGGGGGGAGVLAGGAGGRGGDALIIVTCS